MARSAKKKPYVFERLLTKVEKLNETGKKKSLKHGHAVQQSILHLLDIHSQYIMEKNLFQYMLLKIW